MDGRYSNLEVDLTAKSDSSSLYIAVSDIVDGEGFGSGTTYISDCIVADHQDDDNDSGVVDGATLQLAADLPMSASPGHGSVTHQASPMRVNSEITQGSASYNNLDVTKEAEVEGIDVFVDDGDNADTCSPRRSGSSTVSSDSAVSHCNISVSKLLDGQYNSALLLQPSPVTAFLQQSDLTNDSLQRHYR